MSSTARNLKDLRPGQDDLAPGYHNIVIAPDYMHGEPALRSVRLRVSDVLTMLASGWTDQRLKDEYDIDDEMLQEVYRFASGAVVKKYSAK